MLAKRRHQLQKLAKVLANSALSHVAAAGGCGGGHRARSAAEIAQFRHRGRYCANRGQFALVARHCFPTAQIIAFEPLATPAKRFQAARRRPTRHTAPGRDRTFYTALQPCMLPPKTIPRPYCRSRIAAIVSAGTREVATETIQVECLACRIKEDDLRPPALLKIDVQGYELSSLQGCEALLQRFSNIYVECSFVELYAGQALAAEVIRHLDNRGFHLSGVYNVQYGLRGQAIQADLLFSKHQTQD